MADVLLNVRVKNKTATEANWTTNNPVLLAGEIAISSDTNMIKVGNGTGTWSTLSYINSNTAVKLANARTIALSGGATGTATSFNGGANITIPVTALDATKLSGTASISTTGNAATATTLQTARTISLGTGVTSTAT